VNLAYRTSFSSNDIFETDLVRATNFTAPVAESPARQGVQPDPAGKIVASTQTIAWLEFECADGSTKLGVWDWVGDIYFSYIRAPRVLVRGDQGEITDSTVRYLEGPTEPMEFELKRLDAGVGGQPDTLERASTTRATSAGASTSSGMVSRAGRRRRG
jgi:hypothetical protein